MPKPNPAAALRHLMDAAKELQPGLTDLQIANAIGICTPALIDWTKGRTYPRGPSRARVKKWISGIVEALPQAFAELEAEGAADDVVPFGASQQQAEAS